jgi:hypothetical protein
MNSSLAHQSHSPVATHIAAWLHQGLDRVRALLVHAPSATSHPLTVFEEAEQVRTMANAMMQSDPRMAQDLYAAADRHELQATQH